MPLAHHCALMLHDQLLLLSSPPAGIHLTATDCCLYRLLLAWYPVHTTSLPAPPAFLHTRLKHPPACTPVRYMPDLLDIKVVGRIKANRNKIYNVLQREDSTFTYQSDVKPVA